MVVAVASALATTATASGARAGTAVDASTVGSPANAAATYTERYRPQFHFTRTELDERPDGLVYYQGWYHLFFQYNPSGNTWGNISWGHAISRDLVHWKQLPVAIPADANELVFSGSAVIDYQNTTGFGTLGHEHQ